MIRLRFLVFPLITVFAAGQAFGATPQQWIGEHADDLVQLYQQFHLNPELSFQEEKTAERMATELQAIGAEVTKNVGGHGVVAVLKNGNGPTVMLRADMDALPVAEQTGLPYASKIRVKNERGATVGVMHACGHDIHMTHLIGVARYLSANKNLWSGTLIFLCQPAEERGAGAQAMLEDGLFARFPRPDYALALHVDPNLAAGRIGYRVGYSLANVDSVDITVHGRGGHGAYPHATIDPIVIAARLILDLQTIVSREIKPIEPAVITVGSIHGGSKHNVIGDSCHLQLTVRSYSDKVRKQLYEAIRRKAAAAAASAGAPEPDVILSEGTPSLWNDEKLAERIVPVFRQAIGSQNVTEAEPSMGGEDFSHYGKAGVPIMMFRLGSADADRLAQLAREGSQPPSLHSPLYYPEPKPTLTTGVVTMSSAALELLKPEQ